MCSVLTIVEKSFVWHDLKYASYFVRRGIVHLHNYVVFFCCVVVIKAVLRTIYNYQETLFL